MTDAPSGRARSTSPTGKIDTLLSTPLSSSKPRGRKPNGTTINAGGKPKGTTTSTDGGMDMDQGIGK